MTTDISKERFDELVANLKPGSFLVVASDDHITIQGIYIDYIYARYPEMTGLPGYTPGREQAE